MSTKATHKNLGYLKGLFITMTIVLSLLTAGLKGLGDLSNQEGFLVSIHHTQLMGAVDMQVRSYQKLFKKLLRLV